MDSQGRQLPEITVKAFILGVVLAIILAAANAYLGLFAGMTVSASIPAAVVSMAVLKLFRRNNILENNMVQTVASSGEALAAGVIFTIPALVILDYWKDFNYVWVMVIGGFGGFLGVLFTIPLRRAFIVEDKLQYPEGIATAEVLKAGQGKTQDGNITARGGSDSSEIKYILEAAIAGGLFKLGAEGLRIWKGIFEAAIGIKGTLIYFGTNLSPALLSVGYIVGLNIAVLVFIGGLSNWLIAIPICAALQDWPTVNGAALPAVDWAHQIWSSQTRYIGVGAMLVGGLWTIINVRSSLVRGISSGLKAYRKTPGQKVVLARTEKDVPMKWVLILIAASVVPLFLLYQAFVAKVSVALSMAIIMLIMGFLFSAVAGYMAGLVGSSNNPISGVTIATVVVSGLLLSLLMGSHAKDGPAAAIIIGSVVCCAAAMAGDTMQDLKAGYIVGSTPWKQQLMEVAGSLPAAILMAPVLTLLYKAYGFAGHSSAKENPLIAVQANLIASVAKGVFEGKLPWGFIWIGAAVAAAMIILDEFLRRRSSSFRTPVLAVAIGFYLPFDLSVPIFAGGLIHYAAKAYHTKRNTDAGQIESSSRNGLLFASGLITGEALMGIFLAIPIVLVGKSDVLTVLAKPLGSWPGVILLVAIGYWLYRTALAKVKS